MTKHETLFEHIYALNKILAHDGEQHTAAVRSVLDRWTRISPAVRAAMNGEATLSGLTHSVVEENLAMGFPLWNWRSHATGEVFTSKGMQMEQVLNGAIDLGNGHGCITKPWELNTSIRLGTAISLVALLAMYFIFSLAGREYSNPCANPLRTRGARGGLNPKRTLRFRANAESPATPPSTAATPKEKTLPAFLIWRGGG